MSIKLNVMLNIQKEDKENVMLVKIKNSVIFFLLLFLFDCWGGADLLQIDLACDDDANGGNAVVVTVYQLLNSDKFKYTSFESLIKNPEMVLGSDLIPNSKFERTMVPNETFELKEMEIKKDAAYLGVVADFHSPATDGWHQIIPLDSGLDEIRILIHENSLSIEKK